MKIAYFGGDWYFDCVEVFKQHGHSIDHIFISQDRPNNQRLLQYALDHAIPVTSSKPTAQDINELKAQGVDCFFSSEYPWMIPLQAAGVKTINVHPTLLPEGRGPTPIIWLLKKYRQQAGVTFHKLTDKFDQGDIIFQKPLEVDPNETWETLVAKLNLTVPKLLDELLADFSTLYRRAQPQSVGSYWPKIELADRTINWNDSVDNILQLVRACGRFGVVVTIAGQKMLVNHIQVSRFHHNEAPGMLIREDDTTYVIATVDGIVVVMKQGITEKLNQPH